MIVFLSTSDTDLLTLQRVLSSPQAAEGLPPVHAANPASPGAAESALDTLQQCPGGPAVVVLRLLGGRRACPEVVDAVVAMCRERDFPLLALAGDGRPDPELAALCSVPSQVVARVGAYLQRGGSANLQALLRYLSDTFLGTACGSAPPAPQPEDGIYHPDLPPGAAATLAEYLAWRSTGASAVDDSAPNKQSSRLVVGASAPSSGAEAPTTNSNGPLIGLLFYRAHWLSGNLAFVDALVRALERQGCEALPVFCQSLRPARELGAGDAGDAGTRRRGDTATRRHGDTALRVSASPASVLERYFLDEHGRARVDAVISTLSFAASRLSTPATSGLEEATEATGPAGEWFARLGVPVLQALVCTDPRPAWQGRATGLSPLDVAMQVALPEFDGRIITVPISFKEPTLASGETGGWRLEIRRDRQAPVSNLQSLPQSPAVVQYQPDEERCEALARQVAAWSRLQRTPNARKRVAIVLGNYPSTNGRIGNAVGLDTPASLVTLLAALRATGYTVGDFPESGDELMHRLIDAGTYDAEFGGARAETGAFPGLRFGNVFVGVQPPRGWSDDPDAIYHDPELPPPAPYVAFHRWLRTPPPEGFGADAIIHLGKHGTLEWLPGKAVGLSPDCAPDALLGELPLVYPFIVNDPGEGTQAKRRAHAVLVGHLVPPLAPAGRYGELAALERLIQEEQQARVLDPAKVPLLRRQIWDAIVAANLDEDLGLRREARGERQEAGAQAPTSEGTDPLSPWEKVGVRVDRDHRQRARPLTPTLSQRERESSRPRVPAPPQSPAPSPQSLEFDRLLARLESYLDELQRAPVRDGLHVLGRPPAGPQRVTLLDAMLRLAPAEQAAALRGRLDTLLDDTTGELAAILAALDGGFVPPGPSGSPTRGMWNVLPTGRNFYSVDPQAIPSPAAWETGCRLADALLARHLDETGRYPQTVGLVVWGTAAMRTHGDDLAQALALLGVQPVWQPETGRVTGVDPVPLAALGRPRIDVTLHVSGFFRDAFPHLLDLLDRAVQLVAGLDEPDERNYVAAHVRRETVALRATGLDAAAACRRASYRLFGSKPGCYGVGLLPLIQHRNWQTAADLARAYETWSAYAYGQGAPGIAAREAFRTRFAAIEVATKNQDNREHDLFDSDDYFQYHGGMVATARALREDGTAPRAYFGDSADPTQPVVRDLKEEARRVFRTRVANPQWLAAMQRHGYKGAFEMAATVDYLFGYDATTGVASDWMYERLAAAYVFDPEQRAFFARSNPWALRDVAERLLEAAARGLWEDPSPETLNRLRRVYLETEGDLEARQEQRDVKRKA